MGWSGAAKEPGPGEVLVVDDDVGQGTGPDLGQVDLPGGVVAVPVQAARFAGAFPRGVAGDAPGHGHCGVGFQPDAVFPAVVVLGAECEHGIDDQDGIRRDGDRLVPVVLAGQRVVRAQRYLAGAARGGRAGGAEQQVPRRAEVISVAVIPLAAGPVIAALARLAPRFLKSSSDARMVGRPRARSAAASSCPKLVFPAPVRPSTATRIRPGPRG